MRESKPVLVTNTTPLIALTAATGGLGVLQFLYSRVVVPLEVAREVRMGGKQSFGLDVFNDADWLDVQTNEVELPRFCATRWIAVKSVCRSDRLEPGCAAGVH